MKRPKLSKKAKQTQKAKIRKAALKNGFTRFTLADKVTDDELPEYGSHRDRRKRPEAYPGIDRDNGRPSKYSSGFDDIVFQYRLLGLTEERICELLYITPMTLKHWQTEHSSFLEAWQAGGELADAKVAHSMWHRANGYSHQSEQLFYDRSTGEVIREKIVKHYPPDTAAGEFWLTNRRRDTWKKRQSTELGGMDGAPLPPTTIVVQGVTPTQENIERLETMSIEGEVIPKDQKY